jgi:hypothetical protein
VLDCDPKSDHDAAGRFRPGNTAGPPTRWLVRKLTLQQSFGLRGGELGPPAVCPQWRT